MISGRSTAGGTGNAAIVIALAHGVSASKTVCVLLVLLVRAVHAGSTCKAIIIPLITTVYAGTTPKLVHLRLRAGAARKVRIATDGSEGSSVAVV